MQSNIDDVTFKHPSEDQFALIYSWFAKPHVCDFFDNPETTRYIPDLQNYFAGKDYFQTPWLAYYEDKPFAYIMTAQVKRRDPGLWSKWREKKGKTYSMVLLIGEENFLGKGMSHLVIKKFIQQHFQHAAAFLIDAELRNLHAIHVYEKAGFVIVDEFKGEHDRAAGVPHIMMKFIL